MQFELPYTVCQELLPYLGVNVGFLDELLYIFWNKWSGLRVKTGDGPYIDISGPSQSGIIVRSSWYTRICISVSHSFGIPLAFLCANFIKDNT